MSNVIDFNNPDKKPPTLELSEPPGKPQMIEWLEQLLAEVKENKVEGVFCCWTYTDEAEVSSGFRAGMQGMTLLGRVTQLSHRMMNDLDTQ